MDFEHERQRSTHEQVAENLGELFESPYLDEETGHFYVRYGSTVLEISVDPFGPDEAVVTIMAYCVQGVTLEEDLLLGLLEINHQLPFGAFSLVDRDIFFSHSLLGRSLDSRSLLRIIEAVATVSDDYDERIIKRFGGQTALERIRDTGGRRQRQEVGGGEE
ncbi:MAG: YbjN domain-containing protein [Acidobacteria bacterium]|nr:YbjN domain-containing protein [Acidobacteriota bacterium]